MTALRVTTVKGWWEGQAENGREEVTQAPMSDLRPKLNDEERQRFEAAMDGLSKAFPSKTLVQCPLGPDGSIEIKVSRWPTCAEDLDAVLAVVQAVRETFRAREPR